MGVSYMRGKIFYTGGKADEIRRREEERKIKNISESMIRREIFNSKLIDLQNDKTSILILDYRFIKKLKMFIITNQDKDGLCKIGQLTFIVLNNEGLATIRCIFNHKLYNIEDEVTEELATKIKELEEMFIGTRE